MSKSNYDRMSELKAFDETKAGVKGLVDSGISKIPQIFYNPLEDTNNRSVSGETKLIIPVIDLGGLITKDPGQRKEIIKRAREAAETWGFFQVVNHGIHESVLEEMKNGVRRFYEQDDEKKKEFYTRDVTKKVVYNSNFALFASRMANWRDTFFILMAPNPPKPEELPEACKLWGLDLNHLKNMGCAEGHAFIGHYYPACPEPELTMGTSSHSDNEYLTVLLQDHIGGLQVLHDNQWIDVPPVPGALVVNIGDLLQLATNDKFKSVEHRVLANSVGPRISAACFFGSTFQPSSRMYGPIKELLSEDNTPIYRETTYYEYVSYLATRGINSPLERFRL